MRRLLVGALVAAASFGGLGTGTAVAVCDPDYRPLCLSDCPGPMLPDPKDPTDTSWLIRMCPDSASAAKAGDECETAVRCVGYCGNQRFDANRAVSWTLQFVECVS